MGLLNYAGNYIRRKADQIGSATSALIGAGLLSQGPGFMQTYMQRLGGHTAEAQRNVDSWQKIADDTSGGRLETMVDVFLESGKDAIVQTGEKVTSDVDRLSYLKQAYEAIANSGIVSKPIEFLRNIDFSIAKETLDHYVPNIPLDLEGLAYIAAGGLTGMALYNLCVFVGKQALNRFGKKVEVENGNIPA